MKIGKYKVTIVLTEPMLGTVPKNEQVYTKFVATKVLALANGDTKLAEEQSTVPEQKEEIERAGWTGFHTDERGIFIYDYMIRGFLKAAAQALRPQLEMPAFRSHIDQSVFVFPRRIRPEFNGKLIMAPHGTVERPLRAMTMQGPRVTLAKSDSLAEGTAFTFELQLLPGKIKESHLIEWFEYGQLSGLGQFRNGSFGRFKVLFFE